MLKINFHFVLLLVLSIFCSNCAIRYFNDSEYNPIGLVEDNTVSDRTPINQILDEKTELIGKKIYDVKAYVAIYSECLMETQNIQSIALNYHGDPCLEFPIGYQRFRFFEIMVGKENDISLDTLYFFCLKNYLKNLILHTLLLGNTNVQDLLFCVRGSRFFTKT